MMWQIKKLPFYIDLVFCLVLLPVMFMLLPIERWYAADSAFVYLLIGWYYIIYLFNRRLTMNFLLRETHRRMGWALVIILLTLIGTYLFTRYQMEMPMHGERRAKAIQALPKIRLQQQAVWFLYMVVMTFSLAVGLLTELYRQIMLRQSVEFEKKKAELALYKAQINPHFLFNTLNTLYGLMLTASDRAETAFVQFINLMKYMCANGQKDKISVQTEVEYIEQYIELQKYRIPEHTQVFFSYHHDDTAQMEVVPMILITFVENAFKYGVSSVRAGEIYITVKAEGGELMFSVQNPVLNPKGVGESNGIGIENCKQRLQLLYPERHSLQIVATETLYSVVLSLKLK